MAGCGSRDAGRVSTHRIRFEGPSVAAVQVATALADADGVELTGSEPPKPSAPGTMVLVVTVEGDDVDIDAAVQGLQERLPEGSSLVIDP